MKLSEFRFERPEVLQAAEPPEERGLDRDDVRLLVSRRGAHRHTRFSNLAEYLDPGDVLVVNQSATLPASLPATWTDGEFLLNCCTEYGDGVWLVEPRWGPGDPGPLPLSTGDEFVAGGETGHVIGEFPGIDRLLFVRFEGDAGVAMARAGEPIRYGYLEGEYPLSAYQTTFATTPGSAEMPSAARPFTERVVEMLRRRGVGIATLTLHTGVSSLEVECDQLECGCRDVWNPLYPEPFVVPAATARAVTAARERGSRVVAVGTTVVRALETAWDGTRVAPTEGFTRTFVTPERGVATVDALLTGLHDPETTHLAMLYAVAGRERVLDAYESAVDERYLWHEFGDSHLLFAE
ncbi:S-adenosylmethionine:tRNA ribosyltransferase-isomerase [Haloprofundus halobius]|uniref:S-adenosylmethionine:tRNA ribosyltransferase-isomerase n=1 Tax=Haloprofundus halobius TaxID=2876194 RepID=UPI001CCE79B2|nr:S-adenosylmethionine:tRNA ribosyltransferase-isomerase [Haloprofundus halobius]